MILLTNPFIVYRKFTKYTLEIIAKNSNEIDFLNPQKAAFK